jgi:hypothetical protein
MVILHVSTIILVIIRYNMKVVNYIGHNTDPYWLTNYCAVKISLRYKVTIKIKKVHILVWTKQDF